LEGRSRQADEKGVRTSQAAIGKLIARENKRGIASRQIVVAGFSQGGAIALEAGLRYPERLAGIMALSTYLPLAAKLEAEASAQNKDVPIFFAHGSHDPVIPLPMAVASRDKLRELGYNVDWHEYPMQHSVCMAEVADISAWLRSTLR
ncbi:MAG TPA: alpha/beta fold hydrolase, partial [Burkholderiales bacterium]|nr:alpha/beta fold hydrolase [Burkholderiales bacterium]